MMDEMEKNGVDMKEELKEAAKELPEMVKWIFTLYKIFFKKDKRDNVSRENLTIK